MHIGNSIICPVTGIPMIIATGAAIFWAVKKANNDFKKEKILYISAVTALVFALQMINFSIPQTGSSGHIIGGVLLAALLGSYCGFLAMCAIITVQALFFNDGGILALGCNIFNMGFIACFIVYPLIYKPLAERKKVITACISASVAALQLGSLAVIVEIVLSGSITGNIAYFLSLMQALHLPVGIVEGVFTALLALIAQKYENSNKLTGFFFVISLLLAGVIAKYASIKPDGLEWSLLNISDFVTEQTHGLIYASSQMLQSKMAVLSGINPYFAGISGVIAIFCLMILFGKILTYKNT